MHRPYYMVYAPWGGFGNHLRWLLLLDDSYILHINNGINNVILTTSDQKLKFIKEKVYPPSRIWNNWLEYEFKFRNQLDEYIKFTHDPMDVFDELKSVCLISDPDLAYHYYVKMNPTVNGQTKKEYYQLISKSNKFVNFAKEHYPIIAIESTQLYNQNLNLELYNCVLNFLNLTNSNLKCAQEVHQLWYDLHLD